MIISETEKEKSQKLANLYRQLEFEEMGVKEARKDLVAAIAEEARRSNNSSNVTLQGNIPPSPSPFLSLIYLSPTANKATSTAPQTTPNGTDEPKPQQPQQQQPQKSPQLQPPTQEIKAVELAPGEEDPEGDDGLFSGFSLFSFLQLFLYILLFSFLSCVIL